MTMIRIFLLLLYAWSPLIDAGDAAEVSRTTPSGLFPRSLQPRKRNTTRAQVNIQVIQVQLHEWTFRPPTSTVVTTPRPKTSVVFRTNTDRSRDSSFPRELTIALTVALISVCLVLLAATAYGTVYVLTRRHRPKFDHSQAIVYQRPLIHYPEDYPSELLSAERNRRYPAFHVSLPQREFEPQNSHNFRLQREVHLLRGLNVENDWPTRKISC